MNNIKKIAQLFLVCFILVIQSCGNKPISKNDEIKIKKSSYTFDEVNELGKTQFTTELLEISLRKGAITNEEDWDHILKMFTGEIPYDEINASLIGNTDDYFLYHFAKTNKVLNAGDPYKGGFEYRFKTIVGPEAIRVYKDKNSIARIIGYYFHNDEDDYAVVELAYNIPGKLIHNSINIDTDTGYLVFKHKEHLIMVGYYDKDYFFSLEIDPSIAKFEEPEEEVSLE